MLPPAREVTPGMCTACAVSAGAAPQAAFIQDKRPLAAAGCVGELLGEQMTLECLHQWAVKRRPILGIVLSTLTLNDAMHVAYMSHVGQGRGHVGALALYSPLPER